MRLAAKSFIAAVAMVVCLSVPVAAGPYEDGQAAYNRGDYATALRLWRQPAELGSANAQAGLGSLYVKGRGVPQDHAEAAKWFRLAAEQGHDNAQHHLGTMYEKGLGVPRDYTEAVRWWRLAAEQGHVNAQMTLGIMYADGRGVAQNYAEAAKWYRRAAEQGYVGGQAKLGVMYADGRGVTQNYAEAAKWYRLAAEQGNAAAQGALGIRYIQGQGVPQDDAEGAKWLRKSAEQGIAAGQYMLGLMYGEGRGVAQDGAEGAKWLRKSAEQGFVPAQTMAIQLLQSEGTEAGSASIPAPLSSTGPAKRPQQVELSAAVPSTDEKRVALVIGNSAYRHVARLPNPANDAVDMAAMLERLGFEVTLVRDLDRLSAADALITFGDKAQDADIAVAFYAGHGIEVGGENYLIPVDANLRNDRAIPLETILLREVIRSVERAKNLGLVILDACRDNRKRPVNPPCL